MKSIYIHLTASILLLSFCTSCKNPLATDPRDQFVGKYSGQAYEVRSLAIAPTNQFNHSYPAALEITTTDNTDEVQITLEFCHSSGQQLEFEFIGMTTESNTIVMLDKKFLGLSMGDQNTEFIDGFIEFSSDANIKLTVREVRTNATNNQALDDDDYSSDIEVQFNERGDGTLKC